MSAKTLRTCIAAVAAFLATSACAADLVRVIVFPGGFNWPLWVAFDHGFFGAHGIDVTISPTPNSAYQIQSLMEDKFDVAFSTFDNVVAYQEGQGEAALPGPPDLFAFMGGQSGAVRLVAQPDIKSIAELKGKTLAVDAVTTGYAFVMKKILQKNGLGEGDYELKSMGGTALRAEALMQGKTAATILTAPLDLLPEERGFKRLANATDVIGPYQAVLGVARRSWAKEHEKRLVAFIAAYVEALAWMSIPENKDVAVNIYLSHVPSSEVIARKAWQVLVTSGEGFQKKGKLDLQGAATVLKLRSEFGRPPKTLTDPSKYIDESYYRKAME